MNKAGKVTLALGLATVVLAGGLRVVRGGNVGLAETLDAMKDDNLTVAEDIVLEGNLGNEEVEVDKTDPLYLYSEHLFMTLEDKLEELGDNAKEGVVVTVDGMDDVFVLYSVGTDQTSWQLNDNGVYVAYTYVADESGNKRLMIADSYYFDEKQVALNGLMVSTQENDEKISSLYRLGLTLPPEEAFDNRPVSPEEFAEAAPQFKSNPTNFDSLFEPIEKNETSSFKPIRPEKTAMAPWQGDNQSRGAYAKGVQSARSTGRRA